MIQYNSKLQRSTLQLGIAVFLVAALVGCTTRQVSDTLEGSTAQRLVTLSLDRFIKELIQQPEIKALSDTPIQLRVHFLKDHQLINYATQLIALELQLTHNVSIASTDDTVDVEVDVFFNSIGTDSDDFGLTIPTLGVVTSGDGTIDILALDMFHGITEGYAVVQGNDGSIQKTNRVLARIRRDQVSTPIINFPLNQVD